MGTHLNQPPRSYEIVSTDHLDTYLSDLQALAKKHGMELSDVIAAAAVLQAERRNNLYVANGEIFDDQMAGLGEVLAQVAAAINTLRPGTAG